jgi:hypothetical protein
MLEFRSIFILRSFRGSESVSKDKRFISDLPPSFETPTLRPAPQDEVLRVEKL